MIGDKIFRHLYGRWVRVIDDKPKIEIPFDMLKLNQIIHKRHENEP